MIKIIRPKGELMAFTEKQQEMLRRFKKVERTKYQPHTAKMQHRESMDETVEPSLKEKLQKLNNQCNEILARSK